MEHILSKLLSILVLACSTSFAADNASLEISTAHDSPGELQTRAQLQHLLGTYDLSAYYFTKKIVIEERAIPHSHPVLTLNTRHLNQDDELVSTFLHEQLHWYESANPEKVKAAEAELEKMYPQIPVGGQDGAYDRESGYLHLILCYLELQADRQVLGREKTARVFQFWEQDHYRWIYRTVIQDETKIGEIVERHGLADVWRHVSASFRGTAPPVGTNMVGGNCPGRSDHRTALDL